MFKNKMCREFKVAHLLQLQSEVILEPYLDDVFISEIFEEGGLGRAVIMLTSFGRCIVFDRGRISVCFCL